MNVHLHIERLVLDGLPIHPSQAHSVRAALEAQLASLLSGSNALPRAGYAVDGAHAPSIRLAPGESAAGAGRAIAHSVHAALHPAPTRVRAATAEPST